MLQLNDYVFAIPESTAGMYFEVVAADVDHRKFFFYAPFSGQQKPSLYYHADGLRLYTFLRELYTWNQARRVMPRCN